MTPDWFCFLHQKALDALTTEWQSLRDLHKQMSSDYVVWSDLEAAGLAECKREPITHWGTPTGERIYYRLASQPDGSCGQ